MVVAILSIAPYLKLCYTPHTTTTRPGAILLEHLGLWNHSRRGYMALPLLPIVVASAVIAAIHIVENMSDKDRAEAEERAANANFGSSYIPSSGMMDEIVKMADQSYRESIADQMQKAVQLYKAGDISQEEFEALKRKILES